MKIWLISDPHGKHKQLVVPEGIDMVICAGDVGTYRDPYMNEPVIRGFIDWFGSLKDIKHKVFIAGNHDTAIEQGNISRGDIPWGITYLEHEWTMVEGLKIFGSPYTPTFGFGWAYNVNRSKLDEYWKEIPDDTDILVTHGPPRGILDHTENGAMGSNTNGNINVVSCGDKALLNHVLRVQPKIHVFGHIHPEDNCMNGATLQLHNCRTKFINAAVVNLDYKICNNGVIIEI